MEIDKIIEQLSITSCDCHCVYGEEKTTVECTQDCEYCKAVKAAIEIMRKYQKVESAKLKEAYNKGYADGQRALAEHIELCQEEQEPKPKMIEPQESEE